MIYKDLRYFPLMCYNVEGLILDLDYCEMGK